MTDAAQFGAGAFIATGTGTLYGTICTLHEEAGNGATIETSVSASDMNTRELCIVTERVAPLFQG